MRCINDVSEDVGYGKDLVTYEAVPLYACPVCSSPYLENLPACVSCGWCEHPDGFKEVGKEIALAKLCDICGHDAEGRPCPFIETTASTFVARWLRDRHAKREGNR